MQSTFLKIENRAYSKLAAALTSGATSLTVTSGDGGDFPDTYPFHLTIEDEIVSVTNRVVDTMTIVRAQQGTTAAAHPNKSHVALNITKKHITDLNAAVHTIEQAMEVGFTYLKVIGPADYPIDLSEGTVNAGGADIRLSQGAMIDNTTHDLLRMVVHEGSKTTHYFEVGDPISTIKGTFLDLDLTQALRFIGTGKNIDGEVVFRDKLTVGRPAGGGVDFILYGAVANYRVMWDANGDTNGRWTFGDNDYGVDVAFRGATSGVSMLWDASADTLALTLAKMTHSWTTTEATAGEQGFKMTVTDSVVQSAGYIQALLIDHNITGAKSSSAQVESISVDMDIGANVVYAYPIAVYVSKTSNPNISFLAGMQIYLEDMGSGTLGGIAGIDIQIGSTNLGTRHTGIRLVSHTGTARSGILFEKAWTVGIDFSGTGSGGMAATFATADIRFQGGTTLLDDGTSLTLAGAKLVGDVDVSGSTLTLAADQISGDKVEGGTINAITINTLAIGTALNIGDDKFIVFGGVASLGWETADADVNLLVLALPDGSGVDSPTLMIGDQSVLNFDLGTIIDLASLDEPNIVIVDADADSYFAFGFHADDTPHLHTNQTFRLEVSGDTDDYFKFKTDTGVPTIFAAGSYLRIGDVKFTQHSLDAEDDLMVSGEFEVSGVSFFDALVTISPIAAADSHLLISGTAKLNTNEQAIYVNFPSETTATNAVWLTLGSTVTSGDLTGIRSRVTGNATSNGANVRGAYLEAKVGAGKYAAMLEGALIHADYSLIGAGTISGDVRGLTVHISQGTGLTAANLYGILLNIQTRGNESIATDDIGLLIRNQAVGGNGRTMDSGLKIVGLNMGGGTAAFTYDITFQEGATLVDDGTNLTLAGSKLKVVAPDISGTVTAATTLTMPSFTLSGTINVADQVFNAGSLDLRVDTTGYTSPYSGITIRSSQNGITGALITGWHNTASPAAGDAVFQLVSYGKDSGGGDQMYNQIQLSIENPASGSEAGKIVFRNAVSAVMTTVATLSSIAELCLGGVEGSATAITGGTVRAPHMVAGTTTNGLGADLTIAAGKGTGTGDVGQIIFQTPRIGGSGTTLQSLTTIMVMDEADIILSGYHVLYNTDTDSAVEGAMWFSETDKTIEYFNGTDVKVVAVAGGMSFLPEERVMFDHRWELGDIGLVKIDKIKPDGSPHGLLYPFNRALAEAEEILAIKNDIAKLEERLLAIGG